MYKLTVPEGYKSLLNPRQTQLAIKKVKDFFERDLAIQLNLTRVSAPLFVDADSGLNDTLNGVERPVAFDIKGIDGGDFEIVQSLAKWKRLALKQYGFEVGEGVLTGFSEEKENSPVFDSYKFWTGRKEAPYLRDSWDLCTVHYAFEGNCEFYDLSEPISVEIDCDGKNTFTPCTQSDRYCVVQKSSNEEIAEYINRILNA